MTRRDSPRVKLFVRLDPAVGLESRKEHLLERLQALSDHGAIADYDVLAWTRGIRPDGPLGDVSYCRTLLKHVEELQGWVDDNGVDCCGFDSRDVSSPKTGESYDVISLPAICLSIYDGDDVVDVYPRRTGDQLESVDDGLDSLQSVSPQISGQ